MKKKLIALLLCMAMLLSVIPTAQAANLPFTDVKPNAWYYSAVECAYENGLFNGTSATTFAPDMAMSRGMLVSVLYRYEGSPTVSGSDPFTDVDSRKYYAAAVTWAAQNGVVNGTGTTTFAPDTDIAREQMVAILYRYANIKGYNTGARDSLNAFTDRVSISAYARESFQWAVAVGIISGTSATTLSPQGTATRAEVAAILVRFSQCYPEDPQPTESQIVEGQITTSQISDFGYLLYIPANAHEDMPLIVYLHGGSGKGNDLSMLTANAGFPKYLKDGSMGDIPAYVVIPQMPSSFRGWTDIGASVETLITEICDDYGIDQNRISLTGHSMGGTGTWGIALRYPELFSCVAPLSGSVTESEENVESLKNMPVWAFVGSADTVVTPNSSKQFIYELKKVDQYASITELEGAGHFDVPGLVYLSEEYNLADWLISKSK